MMRVALLAPLFESVPPKYYGGTERVVYNLHHGLTAAGIDVTVFASGDSSLEGRVIPMIDQALRLRKEHVYDPGYFHYRMLVDVAERARDFDIIHNHHDYWMLPLSLMTDTPLVTTLHGRLDLPEVTGTLRGFKNSSFVSISDYQRTASLTLPWIRTVYHGIDLTQSEFHETPGKYLAFLGRISWEKRPEWAIEIAKRSGVPLKIAAKIEGTAGQEHYERFVKPHVDGKFVEYVGEISENEKSDFLGNALALVFPIDWPEPFGLVMIEALACGTPVLARPCGSVPELLRNGVTGFCDPDIKRLAQLVRQIPQIDRRVCRAWVEERFSLNRMAEDYIDVYREVVENRRAARRRRDIIHSLQRAAHGNPETQLEG